MRDNVKRGGMPQQMSNTEEQREETICMEWSAVVLCAAYSIQLYGG